MATMNISLPDTLREEMNKLPSVVWSHVAVKAFEDNLTAVKLSAQVIDMPSAIARLKASKQMYAQKLKNEEYQKGLDWAMYEASYEELISISRSVLQSTEFIAGALYVLGKVKDC